MGLQEIARSAACGLSKADSKGIKMTLSDDEYLEMSADKELIKVFNALAVGHALEKHRLQDGNASLGKWMSAALEDPLVCEEMKSDIRAWFESQEFATCIWQPIATAPKTETLFIACDAGGWVFLCAWWPLKNPTIAGWVKCDGAGDGEPHVLYVGSEGSEAWWMEPTYWIPLPEPAK
jgi:hypothetical protein